MSRPLLQIASLAALVGCAPRTTEPLPSADPSPLACNGHPELCERPLDEVVFPASHNAMSSAADGFVAPNQNLDIIDQLDSGIRGLLIDSYSWRGEAWLCHGSCDIGAIPMEETLAAIDAWLDAHPNEVLIFIIQDALPVADTEQVFADSGLLERVYTWEGGVWPTLGELIEADQRVIVSAEFSGPPPAWYHHAWDLFHDTPYTFRNAEAFSCELNRGSRDNPLFLINHWINNPLPLQRFGEVANTAEQLRARVAACEAETGRLPTLLALDFVDLGALFTVVDELNLRG